jgi:hypothetical protein
MFLSPVADLSKAMRTGNLGHLPTLPWAVGLGNCWGWIVYGYLRQNIFVMLANVPGLFVSIFLNNGAIKVQYYTLWKQHMELKNSRKKSELESGRPPPPPGKTDTTSYQSITPANTVDASTTTGSLSLDDNLSVSSLLSSKSTDTVLYTSGLSDQERILYPLLVFWFLVSVYVGWFGP